MSTLRLMLGVHALAAVAAVGASVPGPVAAATCDGTVVVNDSADPADGGTPLAGAKVSDGVQVVLTDTRGRYAFDAAEGRPVFLVKPPGHWLIPGRRAWKHPGACGDFAVGHPDGNLHWHGGSRVLVIADPQAKSPADVEYFRRDVVHTIQADHANAFSIQPDGRGRVMEGSPADLGIVLGDITDDAPALHPAIVEALDDFAPMLYLPATTTSTSVPWPTTHRWGPTRPGSGRTHTPGKRRARRT
ncbi:MAG TPA: hypothetical protein VFM73_07180 [Xanthomonadaceae bacterium]|nr:hypothetical protein [Xanthomonadaceae bacterium]